MEHVDDERDQDHGDQYVDKAADVRGIAPFGQQEPLESVFQSFTSRTIRNAGAWLGNSLVPAFPVFIFFHDTHSIISDLPCKSQCCAKLGQVCANSMQIIKYHNIQTSEMS